MHVRMNKRFNKIVIYCLGLSFFGMSLTANNYSQKTISTFAIGNYSTDAANYYQDITASSGKQLAAQLHDLITSTHKYYTSYTDNGANGYQQQTDQYYEDDSKVDGYIYEFYSGVKWPNGWYPNAGDTRGGYNREHCWCQSNSVNNDGQQMWGEKGGGADMHHLRPVETRLNSTRNNHPYGEISDRDNHKVYAKLGTNTTYALGGYLDASADVFEPLDSKKGDVARIILYTYLHYNSYTISDLFGSYGTTNGSGSSSYFSTSLLSLTKTTNQSTEADALEMLLSWNASDPVDITEQRRNEQVATYQGNRNPFIDNSDYAEMIWGTGSSTPTVNSVSVSPSTLKLDLSENTTGNLTAIVNVSNGASTAVNWTSSNTNVASVSSSGLVTAINKGSCTITATSTINPNKSASCSVKVSDFAGDFSWDLTTNSYDNNPTHDLVTWSHNYATMESIRNDSNTAVDNYLGGDANNRTSSRFYSGNTLKITPTTNYTITSVVFVATTTNYASTLGISSWTNASSNVSDKNVTVTPTNGNIAISAIISATCGFTSVTVYISRTGSSSTRNLSNISLNTSNVQTEFYVGDTFDYSGLIVTAYYDDGTEDIVNPSNVSSPDMSTSGNKTITISYVENGITKTATYSISVLVVVASEIYASTNKTYHPGETIIASDIYVEDDLGNEITDFTFNNDGYRFTYNDSPSGGSEADKTFINSVTYLTFSCDLTVNISRINYVAPTSKIDTMNRSWTGVTGTYYTAWSDKTLVSGAVYAGYSAGGNDSIQLRTDNSNSGIITTSYSGDLYISSISLTWNSNTTSGRTLNIYGKTSSYSATTDLFDSDKQGTLLGTIIYGKSPTLKISGSYKYIGIRSASGALYLSEIVITYKAEDEPTNVANYIMYEDTNGQCNSKFSVAKEYFENLSKENRNVFMTSNDYVITSARNRLVAWASYLGKSINYANDDYVIVSAKNMSLVINQINNDNSIINMLIISFLATTATISVYFLIKRKEQ